MQRAKDYKPGKIKVNFLWASRKYDGVRGRFEDHDLITREYISIHGLEHIKKECKDIINKYGFSFIEGELTINGEAFDTIQSAVLSQYHIKKSEVVFNVFAVGSDFITTGEMVSVIRRAFKDCHFLKPIVYEKIQDRQIESKMQQYINEGFEGIVLRLPEAPLADDSLYRKKPFIESDFVITDIYESKTIGLLGGLIIKGKVNGKEIVSRVGVGFSRKTFWDIRDTLIGKIAEVSYKNITKACALREPVFLKLKEDRQSI